MAKGVGEAGENPLVPNVKLRQMYTTMLEARTLDEALAKKIAKGKSRGRLASIWGQEAVRVSTAIDLGADDLVSDVAPSAAMALILGGEPASLLKMFSGADANKRRSVARAGDRVLPAIDDAEERLSLAVGAASALKTQGRRGVLVAYARKGELGKQSWQGVLAAASKLELPMIFVVLPSAARAQKGVDRIVACEAARAAGVPGMPVDACDAVALYRAVQESLGRTRSGDGPVLIECVSWQVEGQRTKREDPLEHLKESLLARKICAPAWFDQTRNAVRRRILAKRCASRNRRTTKRA